MTATRQCDCVFRPGTPASPGDSKERQAAAGSMLSDIFRFYMPDAEPLDIDEWLDVVTGQGLQS